MCWQCPPTGGVHPVPACPTREAGNPELTPNLHLRLDGGSVWGCHRLSAPAPALRWGLPKGRWCRRREEVTVGDCPACPGRRPSTLHPESRRPPTRQTVWGRGPWEGGYPLHTLLLLPLSSLCKGNPPSLLSPEQRQGWEGTGQAWPTPRAQAWPDSRIGCLLGRCLQRSFPGPPWGGLGVCILTQTLGDPRNPMLENGFRGRQLAASESEGGPPLRTQLVLQVPGVEGVAGEEDRRERPEASGPAVPQSRVGAFSVTSRP